MDEAQRKSLWLAIILGLIILVSIITFLWSNFLNYGKIAIFGPTPFFVEVFAGQRLQCDESPCILKDKIGRKNLIIAKKDFQTLSQDVVVKLWRTEELNLKFSIIPYLEEIADFPEVTGTDLEITFDENAQMQKLSQKGFAKAIVFFPKSLKNPRIFSSQNFALVVDDKSAYKIDLIENSKKQLLNLKDLQEGEWSENGHFFLFTALDQSNFSMLKEDKVIETELSLKNTLASWAGNELIFVTQQDLQVSDSNKLTPISLTNSGFTVGKYHPATATYTKIHYFPEITTLPDRFVAATNGKVLYLQKDKKNFRIILEKF